MNRYRRQKDLKYFIRVFISGVIGVLIVSLTSEFFAWPTEGFMEAFLSLIYIPFFLVLLIFAYDRMQKRFLGKQDQKSDERDFLLHTSKEVREQLDYGKEEFEKLQADEKFQSFYQDAFHIYKNGENQAMNFNQLKNRFSEDEFASDAVEVVVEETKKLRSKKIEETQETQQTSNNE